MFSLLYFHFYIFTFIFSLLYFHFYIFTLYFHFYIFTFIFSLVYFYFYIFTYLVYIMFQLSFLLLYNNAAYMSNMITSYRDIVFYCAKCELHTERLFNKEHYRAHINNWDTHTEFAMHADSLKVHTHRTRFDNATRFFDFHWTITLILV
jgi:hypothetical protein